MFTRCPHTGMEILTEPQDGENRWEHWKLFYNLKTTVEGLLSTNNPNVWSRYGGLQRLHKDMNAILGHRLKNEQVYYKQKDYWRFVWCVRYLCPHLSRHVEQFNGLEPGSGVQCLGEGYKAERWLLHSLQTHVLSAQLRPLLQHRSNTMKYYSDGAFLLSEPHVSAMFQCLEAVEQNNPRLLALIDTSELSRLKEPPTVDLLKSPSVCLLLRPAVNLGPTGNAPSSTSFSEFPTMSRGESRPDVCSCHSGQGAPCVCGRTRTDSEIPQICFTSPASPGPQESHDSADGDLDDGPEYLAIGNLGKQRRRDSSSSCERMGTQGHTSSKLAPSHQLAPPITRRCSFSEVQRVMGRSSKGHVRSLSDTGITQKPRNESVATPSSKSCGQFTPQSSDGSNSSLYMEPTIELMKCNMRRPTDETEEDGDSDSEIQQLKQKIRVRRLQIRRARMKPAESSDNHIISVDSGESQKSSQDSFHPSDSGSDKEVEDIELKDDIDAQSLLAVSQSGLSLSLASLFSGTRDRWVKWGFT
ncbi:hypothetical protein DNTS_015847 [Danionella cerebrum]|uniref:RUN domain-containing protein n=1 Tax=Danionella cerebrum TaxID=2873325 RepID=A0A553RNY4_9TELE|nr:hypothetical protein DNTS_015847 [Danionella translucida]